MADDTDPKVDDLDDLDLGKSEPDDLDDEPKKSKTGRGLLLIIFGVILLAGGWWCLAYLNHPYRHDDYKMVSPLPSDSISEPAVVRDSPPTQDAQAILLHAAELTQASGTRGAVVASGTAVETTTAETPSTPLHAPLTTPHGRFLGKKDAPVKMIEFASLTCSHCALFHSKILPAFRTRYVDTGLVQIEFRPFPLNKPALDATKITNCLPDAQFFPFTSMLFETQDHWAYSSDYIASLKQNAKLAGLSDAEFDKCLNDKDAEAKLVAGIKADAEKYKIESTPTFILNDGAARVTGALPVNEFSKQIDPLLLPAQTKSNAP